MLGKRCVPQEGNTSPPPVNIVEEVVEFLDCMSEHFQTEASPTSTTSSVVSQIGTAASCGRSRIADEHGRLLNKTKLQELRGVIFSLLELEMNSYKWYKDSALGYFIDMEQKIAKTCGVDAKNRDYKMYLRNFVYNSNDDSRGQEGTEEAIQCAQTIVSCLQGEVERLKVDLFSLSTGTSIPQAFLDCDPEKKHEAKYSLDGDGFEIL